MQLEQQTGETDWNGTVPNAFDLRILGFVGVIAALAASLNVPYGGIAFALVAFGILAGGGLVVHALGQRKLRRITDGLVERWVEAGGEIESVTRSSGGMRTEWTIRTTAGTVTIGGVAVVPIARLSVEWHGVSDSMDAADAEANLDRLADSLFEEIFEIGSETDATGLRTIPQA
ncbi:hypothetical protein EA462_08590 [Natrarchaeobius halalkaliphilus]|uniref:Uncharacterized protein n=1 Tax=Natrarchaeobius halalkaliphilus TaxID=1679091 RepID=A0A3N6LM49_9EURY|nr:hypothetical protein [Natrarchaeobius halalkaliphilus]RQG90048.1 hypothetical protein EA462_08590 [Natrarchaeobius halalkaliphilus]